MFKKFTKFSYALLILMFFGIFMAACGGDDDEKENTAQATPTASPPTVALVMKTLTNPFFIEMERGAREAEAELGINLVVRTAAQETSIEQQIEIIDNLIAEKVDAIVVSPGDSQALIPVLKKAQDAGIVVINIDNRLDPAFSEQEGLANVPFISVNNEQGAYLSAQYLSNQIEEPANAIILEGIRTAQNAEDRKNGALRAFGENDNINVVAMETANWKIDEAYDVIKLLFEANPDIDVIFAANDMMALGVIQYLQETQQTDVIVGAYDALEEAKVAILAGTLTATVDQQAARQGYLGVEYAVRAINGETLPAETLIDVILVTEETLDK